MPLKEILVVLDSADHCDARLKLAVELAARHGADLAGLYVVTHQFYVPARDDAGETGEKVRAMFEAVGAAAGVATRWIGVESNVVGVSAAEIVNLHAHYFDLVIVGQDLPEGKESILPQGLPERVIIGSGRPVLIVPYAGEHGRAWERIMVAWKGGRESTRAMADALPLLKKADDVCVLEIDPGKGEEHCGERLRGYLAAHGIGTRGKSVAATEIGIGNILLNRIAVEGSTLLVMGGYAPMRLGSPALGEVARHILKHMTVPVLMSH